jgi:hypothetical protein
MDDFFQSILINYTSYRRPIIQRKYTFIKRKQKEIPLPLFAKFFDIQHITTKIHDYSCKRNCFSTISPEIIQLICHQYVPKDTLKKNE